MLVLLSAIAVRAPLAQAAGVPMDGILEVPALAETASDAPIPPQSPVVEKRPIPAATATGSTARWYDTTWGKLGIGALATGATLAVDKPVNRYVTDHINPTTRNDLLDAGDVLTWGSVGFAAATWFQSPWASPKLARASSVAITAAAITTFEVAGFKYVFGRARPSATNNDPYDFDFFSSRYSNDILGGELGNNANTSSFPSGHSALVWAVVTPYAQVYRQPWLYTIPVAASLVRVTTPDGHWASDVVGGAFLGYLTADLTNKYFPKSDFGVLFFGHGVTVYGRF